MFIQIKGFAQSHEKLDLKERTVNLQMRYPVKFIADNPKNINENDSLIILGNKDTLYRYKIQQLSLIKSDSSTTAKILILIGINRKNIPLIVIDNNRNKNFTDDSIYQYPPAKSNIEFFQSLPQISLNIPQKNDSELGNESILFLTLSPNIKGTLLLNDSAKISMTKAIGLSFYATVYLGANFIVDGRTFEIAIIPHPLAIPVLKDSNSAYGFPKWVFNVYELRNGKKDSLVYFDFFKKFIKNLKEPDVAFKVLSKYIEVIGFSLDSNSITINIMDSGIYLQNKKSELTRHEKLDSFQAFSLNSQQIESYFFKNEKLSFLEFSGSWCLPCKEVLPEVKALHSKYGNQMNFLTILEEQNLSNAQKYFKENNLLGKTFYEDINEKKSFKNRMKVSIYPAFYLINGEGRVIYHSTSSGGLVEIENEIKSRLAMKMLFPPVGAR